MTTKVKNTNTYGYTPEQFKRFKKHAWLMLLSFGFTYLFFYNGRQNINLVMTHMQEHFSSDLGTLGVVTSALFWCYAFGQLVSGRLGALIGYKRLMMIGVAASAVLNVTISFQNNRLHVTNAEGKYLEIFNLTGVRSARIRIDSNDKYITLNLPRGCYLMKVDKIVRKVSIL